MSQENRESILFRDFFSSMRKTKGTGYLMFIRKTSTISLLFVSLKLHLNINSL